MNLVGISVRHGFLPRFEKTFLLHFGMDSCYVRTLSDYFTTGMVRMLKFHNRLESWESVAFFSTPEAVEKLAEYFNLVEGVKEISLREAFGKEPLGSTEILIDHCLGDGTFNRMCQIIEELEGGKGNPIFKRAAGAK